ncbi:MAG: hypothetical protein J0H67_11035 [Rhodospirillales bacterium]|nr:hypothetical protein [Rhodospirillales bacterium]
MRPLIALLAAAGLAWSTAASAQSSADAASGAAATALTPTPTRASTPATAGPVTATAAGPASATSPGSVAATVPGSGAATASGPSAAASAERTETPADKPAKKRPAWEQRFAKANTTGDGRLTLEQAKAGYTTVARHFAEIDRDSKGWVTTDDLRAWHKARRAARSAPNATSGTATNDALRPRPAIHRAFPTPQQDTSADPAPRPVDGTKPDDPS